MNNFKFRIWDKKNSCWAKISSFKLNHAGELVWNRIESSPNGQDDFIIRQWTRLYDSSAKEIFEGDILIDTSRKYGIETYVVYFGLYDDTKGDGHYGFYIQNISSPYVKYSMEFTSTYSLFGNIFETPQFISDYLNRMDY